MHRCGEETERAGLSDQIIRDHFTTKWLLGDPKAKRIIPWLGTVEDDHVPRGQRIIWIGSLASHTQKVPRTADGTANWNHIANNDVEDSGRSGSCVLLEVHTQISRVEFKDFADSLLLFAGDRGEQTATGTVNAVSLILHEVVLDRSDFRVRIGCEIRRTPDDIWRTQRTVFLNVPMTRLLGATWEVQSQRIRNRSNFLLEDGRKATRNWNA